MYVLIFSSTFPRKESAYFSPSSSLLTLRYTSKVNEAILVNSVRGISSALGTYWTGFDLRLKKVQETSQAVRINRVSSHGAKREMGSSGI